MAGSGWDLLDEWLFSLDPSTALEDRGELEGPLLLYLAGAVDALDYVGAITGDELAAARSRLSMLGLEQRRMASSPSGVMELKPTRNSATDASSRWSPEPGLMAVQPLLVWLGDFGNISVRLGHLERWTNKIELEAHFHGVTSQSAVTPPSLSSLQRVREALQAPWQLSDDVGTRYQTSVALIAVSRPLRVRVTATPATPAAARRLVVDLMFGDKRREVALAL